MVVGLRSLMSLTRSLVSLSHGFDVGLRLSRRPDRRGPLCPVMVMRHGTVVEIRHVGFRTAAVATHRFLFSSFLVAVKKAESACAFFSSTISQRFSSQCRKQNIHHFAFNMPCCHSPPDKADELTVGSGMWLHLHPCHYCCVIDGDLSCAIRIDKTATAETAIAVPSNRILRFRQTGVQRLQMPIANKEHRDALTSVLNVLDGMIFPTTELRRPKNLH